MSHIGFIGYGEAARNIIDGLRDCLNETVTVYDKNPDLSSGGKTNKITAVDSIHKLVSLSDVIVVAVPGEADKDVFLQITENDIRGKMFVDICTASAEDKNFIDKTVISGGGSYVDVAVLGSVPKYKNKVPIIISGSGAAEFQKKYSGFCGSIQNAGDAAGDAIRIKLCRSVYMKGLAALLIETRDISRKYGIEKEVFSSIAESMNADPFEAYSNRIIDGAYRHWKRQKEELEECAKIASDAHIDTSIIYSAIRIFDTLGEDDESRK